MLLSYQIVMLFVLIPLMMPSSYYTTSFDGYEVMPNFYSSPRLWFPIAFPGPRIMNPFPISSSFSFQTKSESSRNYHQIRTHYVIEKASFQDGDGGQVKWASNCDFKGFDIDSVHGRAEECGSNCLSNSQCTHFTWYLDVCYIKDVKNPPISELHGGVCGYVVSRNGAVGGGAVDGGAVDGGAVDGGAVGGGAVGGGQTLDRNSQDYLVLWKTIYGEARGEPEVGQRAVAWVIFNRTKMNRSYWGGNTITGVCRAPYQFECWNGKSDIIMSETAAKNSIDNWLPYVFQGSDPSKGSTYFNNPDKEGYPDWTTRVVRTIKIGNHQFYKEP